MAIFTKSNIAPVEEQFDVNVEDYPYIMPTIESAYEIACEGYHDMYKLLGGLYASDIMIEEAVKEGAEAEPLIESNVKEFINKAVAKFTEIRNRIVAWFKKIVDNLKIKFASSKDFVTKYESRILEKVDVAKDYKPARHDFNDTKIRDTIGKAMAEITAYAKADSEKKSGKSDNFVAQMVKKADPKATTIGELKGNITKTITGAEVSTQVSKSEVTNMIKYCKNIATSLAAIEDLKNKNVSTINNIIKDLNGSGKEVEVIHAKVRNYNAAVSAIQQLNTVGVSLVNQINKEYIATMRGLMLYKVPTKESVTSDEELMGDDKADEKVEESTSIFESALNMI